MMEDFAERMRAAEVEARQAVAASPRDARGHMALGDALRHLGKLEESLAAYDRAIGLRADYLDAHVNRGAVLQKMGRGAEAIAAWRTLVELARGKAAGDSHAAYVLYVAHVNLGGAFLEQGDVAGAHGHQREAMRLRPDSTNAHSDYLLGLNYLAETTPAELLEEHKKWWARHAALIVPQRHGRPGKDDRPLKIGFVSCDFRVHPVAAFLRPVFEKFDRSRFKFFCYANIPTDDEMTPRFRDWATGWRDIVKLPDHAVAELIRRDEIDILVDLGGHTGHSRLLVFAYKAAPIQVSWLGYPATTGAPTGVMDYRITDGWADPEGMTEGHYTERLFRLERPAWCFSPTVARTPQRTEARSGPFTFGAYNNIAKVTPQLIELWSRILAGAPGSQIVVKIPSLANGELLRSVRERFARHGVEAERVTVVGRFADAAEYLDSYGEIDLALDTYPYHGTTTTCEALYMGVPVLTLAGQTHRSRVGVSLLNAVGLGDLVATSAEDYVCKAIGLARDRASLEQYPKDLRERFEQSALMDASGFTRELCKTFRMMWRQWRRN